jgi:micrococcal nuclease
MRNLIVASIMLSALARVPQVQACQCADMRPAACLEHAGAVFEGRVESMQIRAHVLFEGMTLTKRTITEYPVFTLTVGKIYKGSLPDHIRIATGIGTADGSAAPDCSFPFEIGQEYLVYAWEGSSEYKGLLSTSICSGTNPIEDADRYLRQLNDSPPTLEDKLSDEGDFKGLSKLYESRDTAQISGKILGLTKSGRPYLDFRLWRFVDGEWRRQLSFPEKGQDGRYTFTYLQPGEYRIGVLLTRDNGPRRIGFYGGSKRLEEARSVRIGPKESITGIDIRLKPQSYHTVQGKVACADGSPFEGKIKIRTANDWDRNQKVEAQISSCGSFRIPAVYSGKFRVIATIEPESLDPLDAWTINVPEILVPEQSSHVVLKLERERLAERATSLSSRLWDVWRGTVRQILDADRIVLELDGTVLKDESADLKQIRIANIDCPEKGQGGWEESLNMTSQLLLGKPIQLVILQDEALNKPLEYDDSPGLVVGQTVPSDFSKELLKAGLAWHYKKYSADPALAKLEAEAREAKRGIWSKPNPVPPWEYRANPKIAR